MVTHILYFTWVLQVEFSIISITFIFDHKFGTFYYGNYCAKKNPFSLFVSPDWSHKILINDNLPP